MDMKNRFKVFEKHRNYILAKNIIPFMSRIKYRLKCIIPLSAITFGSAKSRMSAEELVAKTTMLKSIANFIFIEISCYNKDKRNKKVTIA